MCFNAKSFLQLPIKDVLTFLLHQFSDTSYDGMTNYEDLVTIFKFHFYTFNILTETYMRGLLHDNKVSDMNTLVDSL